MNGSVYILVIVYTKVIMAKRTVMISIRLRPKDYFWMKERKISPTKVLDKALLLLMRRKKW